MSLANWSDNLQFLAKILMWFKNWLQKFITLTFPDTSLCCWVKMFVVESELGEVWRFTRVSEIMLVEIRSLGPRMSLLDTVLQTMVTTVGIITNISQDKFSPDWRGKQLPNIGNNLIKNVYRYGVLRIVI